MTATTLPAGLTKAESKKNIATVLVLTMVRADANGPAEKEESVYGKPEQRREAHHNAAAAMAAAAARPTRPHVANRCSKVDTLTEGNGRRLALRTGHYVFPVSLRAVHTIEGVHREHFNCC